MIIEYALLVISTSKRTDNSKIVVSYLKTERGKKKTEIISKS